MRETVKTHIPHTDSHLKTSLRRVAEISLHPLSVKTEKDTKLVCKITGQNPLALWLTVRLVQTHLVFLNWWLHSTAITLRATPNACQRTDQSQQDVLRHTVMLLQNLLVLNFKNSSTTKLERTLLLLLVARTLQATQPVWKHQELFRLDVPLLTATKWLPIRIPLAFFTCRDVTIK